MSVVLITGASAGIGRALALEYAKRGDKLVLLARRADRLQELAAECRKLHTSCEVEIYVGDVCQAESSQRAAELAKSKWGRLDIAIANAGVAVTGGILHLATRELQRQLDINILGVFHTVQAAGPLLKESKGRLAIVGSVMSYITLPEAGAYSMSKYAIRAMADALRMEEKDFSVSLVCPGFIESEIRAVNNEGVFNAEFNDPLPAWLVMTAERAARVIVRGIACRRREIPVTWYAAWVIRLERFFPRLAHMVWERIRG